jgi:VCBS repeat-containing protein
MSTKTPAKVTVKVATTNSAAKDDAFSSADYSWLSENGSLKGNLAVLANDPGSASLYAVSTTAPTGTGAMAKEAVGSTDTFAVNYNGTSYTGTLTLNADGTVGFDLSSLQGLIDGLAVGQKIETEFYYTARMATGVLSTSKVSITIDGANDDPTLSAIAELISDGAADDDFGTVSGTLVGSDVDNGAVLSYGLAAGETGTSDYGTLTVNPDGSWSFVPNDAAINGLKGSVPVVFNVAVTDEHGGIGLSTITINLAGANDTAEFSGDNAGSVTEDGTLTAGGTLSVSDRDVGDNGFALTNQTAYAGTYGDFTFDAATGAWTYALRNGAANVQALTSSDVKTDKMTVTSADGTAHDIVVTVSGANEPPPAPTGPVVPADNNHVNSAANDQDDPSLISALANATVVSQTSQYNASQNDDTLVGNGAGQKINGRQGGDKIHGAGGEDQINGNEDGDTLWGGAGNDQLQAGAGTDTVYGGSGNDTISGGADADQLWGGTGADTFTFAHGDSTAAGSDTVRDFSRVEGDKIGITGLGLSWQGILSSSADLSAGGLGYVVNGNGTLTVFADTNGMAGYQADDLSFVVSGESNLIVSDFFF